MIRLRQAQLCLLVSTLVLIVACGPSSPAEKVAEVRGEYKVQLNTFIVQEPEPVEAEVEGAMAEEDSGAGEVVAVAAEEAEGEEVAEDVTPEEGPRPTDVLLDLYVLFNGKESLPGITIDISMADPFQKEKATFRRYLDTGKMVRGEGRQLSLVLEGIEDFETGDVFSVFLRSSVPVEERGEYREFAEAGS